MITKTELYANAKICAIVRTYLQANSIGDLCDIYEANSDGVVISCNSGKKLYEVPIRLGKILDQLIAYKDTNDNFLISFGDEVLDTRQGLFINRQGKKISLTEKEVEILLFLHTNKGSAVTRTELLQAVWNYSKDVQTHTIETHIYRLRQKIEQDPANPQIIITKEDGYSV